MIGNHFKRITAVLLSSIIALTAVSSCSAPELETSDFAADNVTDVIEINSPLPIETEPEFEGYTTDELGQFYSVDYVFLPNSSSVIRNTNLCVFEDKLIIPSRASDYEFADSDTYVSNLINTIYVYDLNDNVLESYDITEYLNNPLFDSEIFVINDRVYISGYDMDADTNAYYYLDYDALIRNDDDALVNVTFDPEFEGNHTSFQMDYDGVLHFSDKFVLLKTLKTSKGTLLVGYDDYDDYMIFVSEYGDFMFMPDPLTTEDVMFQYDDDNVAILDYLNRTYLFNLTSYNCSEEPVELYYVHGNVVNSIDSEPGYYSNSYEGLAYIDTLTKQAERILDYNCVIGDTSIVSDGSYVGSYNGCYCFVGSAYGFGDFNENAAIAIVKPTDNPYSGKKVIRMACNTLDESIIKNIKAYNESDSEYFIEYRLVNGSVPTTNNLNVLSTYNSYYIGGDATAYYNYVRQNAEIEAMEYALIKEGDFDLLYGFNEYELFNTPELCMDLSETINTDNLYMNVVDEKLYNGSLYQIPLYFTINTLSCSDNESYSSETSIVQIDVDNSLEEHIARSNDTYFYDPMKFFISDYECLAEMIENDFGTFINIENDTATFNNDYFREVFDYSLSNVKDDIEFAVTDRSNGEYDYSIFDDDFNYAYFYNDVWYDYISISTVLDAMPYWHDYSYMYLYGVPTHSGQGLTAEIASSIAVYANTGNKNASIDFVNYLLGDNVIYTPTTTYFYINKNVNKKLNLDVFNQSDMFYVSPDSGDFDCYFTIVEAMIGEVDNVKCSDSIIMSVIMQTIVNNVMKGADFNEATTLADIETAVINVLDRY